MSSHSFRNVREPLLRAGISPRHVNRYITELQDHLTDLIAQERSRGTGTEEAEARARTLLGTDAQLVVAMLERSPPRALSAKAPWAVFGLFPVVALIVLVMLLNSLAMGFFSPYRALGTDIPEGARAVGMALSFVGSYLLAPALAAACIAVALRQRLGSRWIWIGLAAIALLSGPFGVHIHFMGAEAGAATGIRGSVIPAVYMDGRINGAATLGMIALRAVAFFALFAAAFHLLKQRMLPGSTPH
ncbi:MAG TPA: hypothetical protein VNQ32_10160 [Steroidobacteraceae bacterium]|nr:hypothetical protein [Steroidobacteraceae bacterium]